MGAIGNIQVRKQFVIAVGKDCYEVAKSTLIPNISGVSQTILWHWGSLKITSYCNLLNKRVINLKKYLDNKDPKIYYLVTYKIVNKTGAQRGALSIQAS